MGIEDLGLLLENIEEYVMVEKKVVTYKWLSRVFSLNVNQAKQLLCIFHMKHKNMKHKSIQGVYYVSGMRTNSEGHLTHQICIVPEDDLEATKAQLDPLTGVHLYSVQKGKPKDTAPLYAVDFEQLKKKVFETTEFSMVRCDEAKISQVINSALRPVTPPALKNKVTVIPKQASKGSSKFEAKKSAPVNKSAPLKAAVKPTSKATTAAKATYAASKKPAAKPTANKDLSNFFSKGKAETKKPAPVKTEVKSPRKAAPEPKKSLLHNACVKEGKKEVEEKKNKIRITSPGKRSKPLEPPVLSEEEMETEEKEVEKKPAQNKKREVKLMELSDEDEEKEEEKKEVPEKKYGRSFASKRKRVRKFSDEEEKKEEDQGIGLEEEEEDQFVLPEETSPKCKKSKVNGEKRRKRVKKLVSKTKLNEEGFMETEKVWEEQSCTDEEEEETKVEEVVTVDVPKKKQSNMMSFFKKS